MKTKFHLYLFLLFLSGNISAYGQNDGLQNITPPSPRTVEFNKFIDHKVSIANGLPEININFYNITVDGNTIPIGISYHASGIKYGQSSGDVGLGWMLSPGYRVSRTVNGMIDEISTMPDMNNVSGSQTIMHYLNNAFTTPLERDQYLARYVKLSPDGDIPLVTSIATNYLDGQFDLFTLGLPGQDSKFIITDRNNKIITQLNSSVLKMNYTTGMDGLINGFNILDGNGTQYKLGQGVANSENLQVTVSGQLKKYSNAWLLSELKTRSDKTITFGYTAAQETSAPTPGSSRTFISGDHIPHTEGGTLVQCYIHRDYGTQVSPGSSSLYNVSLLSSITGVEESVSIIRNTNGTVSSILVKRNQDNRQLKKVLFYYSSFWGKTFLDSVHVQGSTDEIIERYGFEYESKNSNFTYYDCFGYYQNDPQKVTNGEYAPKITFSYHKLTTTSCGVDLGAVYSEGVNKSYFNSQTVYMLKKITYPTGGSTSYTFESNVYKDPVTGNNISGGGLRIAKIVSDDLISSTGKTLEKKYVYGESYGAGILFINYTDPKFYVRERKEIVDLVWGSGVIHLQMVKKLFHTSSAAQELNDGYLQSKIGWYPKVRELSNDSYIDYKFSLLPETNVNLIQPYSNNNLVSIEFPTYYIPQYNFWDEPVLTSKIAYSSPSAGVFQSIQKEELEYYPITIQPLSDEFIGLKVTPFALKGPFTTFAVSLYDPYSNFYNPYTKTGLNSLFNYATYKITRANVLLKKKITTIIDNTNGKELKEIEEYEYNNYSLIAKEKKQVNNDQLLTTEYKYPFSYSDITSPDIISQGVKKLSDLNIVNSPIEMSVFRSNTDGSNKRLLSSYFTSYRSDKPLPDNIAKIETNTGIANFNASSVQAGAIQRDSRYVSKFLFDSYDIYNNLLQQRQSDNVKKSYVWGYNAQYPIAEVVNAPVKDIFHTSFEEDGDSNESKTGRKSKTGAYTKNLTNLTSGDYIISYWKKPGSTWEYVESKETVTGSTFNLSLSGHIDEVRFYPVDAQMITYTYDPLIGMTSQCDVDNMITYYEYDDFGRLKHIRDQDKNIVKKICYNYAGQPENCIQFPNDDKSGNYTRNNCGTGYVGSSVYVSIPGGMFTSSVSVADANLQATNYGQAQANLNGTCTAVCTNCTGRDKKCINGVCKTGIRVNVQSYPFGSGYRCVFYYRWSDGSTSPEYFENTSQPCMLD